MKSKRLSDIMSDPEDRKELRRLLSEARKPELYEPASVPSVSHLLRTSMDMTYDEAVAKVDEYKNTLSEPMDEWDKIEWKTAFDEDIGGDIPDLAETTAPWPDQRLKQDAGKLRLDLIPPEAIRSLGEVLTFGLGTHDENGWLNLEGWRVVASLKRHLLAWEEGEKADKDSGLSHLKHLLTNAMFLDTLESRGKLK